MEVSSASATNGTSALYDQSVSKNPAAEVQRVKQETEASLFQAEAQKQSSTVNLPDHLGQNINTTA